MNIQMEAAPLNIRFVLDRDCVTMDTDRAIYRKGVKRAITYCIEEVEKTHGLKFY